MGEHREGVGGNVSGLTFRMLGGLDIERDGQAVALAARRQRALLALLLVEAGRVVPVDRLIDQLVGCGTSVGANYCEANEGVSKKDFKNIVGRCVKEAKETKYFLRLIAAAEPKLAHEARQLYREAKELHLIFASIYRK